MWNRIKQFCVRVGTARAAAELARNGHYELAKKMILENK